jgi:hypothetical protein
MIDKDIVFSSIFFVNWSNLSSSAIGKIVILGPNDRLNKHSGIDFSENSVNADEIFKEDYRLILFIIYIIHYPVLPALRFNCSEYWKQQHMSRILICSYRSRVKLIKNPSEWRLSKWNVKLLRFYAFIKHRGTFFE